MQWALGDEVSTLTVTRLHHIVYSSCYIRTVSGIQWPKVEWLYLDPQDGSECSCVMFHIPNFKHYSYIESTMQKHEIYLTN